MTWTATERGTYAGAFSGMPTPFRRQTLTVASVEKLSVEAGQLRLVLMPMPCPPLASCLEHAWIRLSETEPLSELAWLAGVGRRVACHEAAQLEHVDGA